MKLRSKFAGACLLFSTAVAQPAIVHAQSGLEGQNEKFSYAVGIQIGQSMKGQGLASVIDLDVLRAAIGDVLEGREIKLTPEEMQEVIGTVQQQRAEAHASERLAAGQAFLEENGKKPGIVTLPSGVQYEVITEGDGEQPQRSDTVALHYEGSLIDGTVFDSSIKRGQVANFPVGNLIPGFTEALMAMKTGSKWRVFIPSELGYGPNGAGRDIGPNEALIFEIELIEIL